MTVEYSKFDNNNDHCAEESPSGALTVFIRSGWRKWLFPALTAAVILILIIAIGATNTKTSNHLGSVEQKVSNLTVAVQSLTSSLQQHLMDTKTSNRLGSVEQSVSSLSVALQSLTTSLQQHVKDAADEVKRLQSGMKNTVDQLSSVSEMLKQLSVLDSLSKTVTSLKCEVNRIINNGTLEAGCCPLDWLFFSSSCYFFSKTAVTWDESRDWCSSQDAQLAVMHNSQEWARGRSRISVIRLTVSSVMTNHIALCPLKNEKQDFLKRHTGMTWYWIGLTDQRGKWEWIDHTPYVMDHSQWRPGQPDNWTGHGMGPGDEDCAHLHNDGLLNDLHCSTRMHFLCQKQDQHSS